GRAQCPRMLPRRTALALAAPLLLPACLVFDRKVLDPTVLVQTRTGIELGVSTEYGVVFLGTTAGQGEADVVAWFGDGPSVEPSLVEPIGDGLYLLETEIRLPWTEMTFVDPAAGTPVEVRGRGPTGVWSIPATVAKDARVEGLLLRVPPELALPSDQVGAGVFLEDDLGRARLLGLVSGRLQLEREQVVEEYLTVVGPTSLWRVAAYHRDGHLRRRFVYRDDVL
ncbi:MAG TPA: hypothetical protein VJP77_02800, partial [Planctomycetota bacterium]|nr:hypothetical protein [Planctomycetota bacterium]